MNYRYVAYQLGLILLVLAAALGLTTGVELVGFGWDAGERLAVAALGVATLLTGLAGAALWYAGRAKVAATLHRRDALLLVALSWLLGAGLAATPYYVWGQLGGPGHVAQAMEAAAEVDQSPQAQVAVLAEFAPPPPRHPFMSPVACYFEAMSGLTTTGATVLGGAPNDIASLPHGLLLWRALTHWLGGLGIVVLFVAVLPMIGGGGKRLFQAEAPGPQSPGVRPRIRETARVLWMIYLLITVAAVGSYRAVGMGWFDSFCHAFSVVSTGGLSTRDASMGAYGSLGVDVVSMVFMLLAGVNFGLMFLLVRGRWRDALGDEELRVYLALKMVVILVVAANLYGREIVTTAGATLEAGVGTALRFAGFQTIALHTGTGFTTADYDRWPFLSRALLVGLMFIGGCAGSTAGGIKVIRFWITLKVLAASLERSFRPRVVRPLRVGKTVVDEDSKLGALTYCLFVLVLVAGGALLIGVFESKGGETVDFLTAATASLSTLGNIGPGFNGVGATQNYGWFSSPSLALMSLLMLLGRLEIYAFAVLFLPRFWRGD